MPAVIFTEIDFYGLDQHYLRKLFVGMTPVRLKLALAMSDLAAATLLEKM